LNRSNQGSIDFSCARTQEAEQLPACDNAEAAQQPANSERQTIEWRSRILLNVPSVSHAKELQKLDTHKCMLITFQTNGAPSQDIKHGQVGFLLKFFVQRDRLHDQTALLKCETPPAKDRRSAAKNIGAGTRTLRQEGQPARTQHHAKEILLAKRK
jgi:hypothetical protein